MSYGSLSSDLSKFPSNKSRRNSNMLQYINIVKDLTIYWFVIIVFIEYRSTRETLIHVEHTLSGKGVYTYDGLTDMSSCRAVVMHAAVRVYSFADASQHITPRARRRTSIRRNRPILRHVQWRNQRVGRPPKNACQP